METQVEKDLKLKVKRNPLFSREHVQRAAGHRIIPFSGRSVKTLSTIYLSEKHAETSGVSVLCLWGLSAVAVGVSDNFMILT